MKRTFALRVIELKLRVINVVATPIIIKTTRISIAKPFLYALLLHPPPTSASSLIPPSIPSAPKVYRSYFKDRLEGCS